MECVICDSVQINDISICNARTKYRKISLVSLLDDFIGSDFEIAIGNDERICRMCKVIFDELDLLRFKLKNIENIIAHKLHRKYKFDRTKELPAIRLDEQTANTFIKGQNGQKFQCENCTFSTDFLDCLTSHNLMHQNEHNVEHIEISDFPCENCHLILPTEYLFRKHNRLFHSDGDDHIDFSLENTRTDLGDVDGDLEQDAIECTVSMIQNFEWKNF